MLAGRRLGTHPADQTSISAVRVWLDRETRVGHRQLQGGYAISVALDGISSVVSFQHPSSYLDVMPLHHLQFQIARPGNDIDPTTRSKPQKRTSARKKLAQRERHSKGAHSGCKRKADSPC